MNVKLRLVSPDLLASMLAVSAPLLHKTPLDVLAQAVPAGFIIASIAWIRAAIINGEFWVVLAWISQTRADWGGEPGRCRAF